MILKSPSFSFKVRLNGISRDNTVITAAFHAAKGGMASKCVLFVYKKSIFTNVFLFYVICVKIQADS